MIHKTQTVLKVLKTKCYVFPCFGYGPYLTRDLKICWYKEIPAKEQYFSPESGLDFMYIHQCKHAQHISSGHAARKFNFLLFIKGKHLLIKNIIFIKQSKEPKI